MSPVKPRKSAPKRKDSLPSQTRRPICEALQHSAEFLLSETAEGVRRLTVQGLEEYGLDLRAWRALEVLASEGPVSQQELGEFLQMDRTTVMLTVDELEAQGWVLRQINPLDARAYLVFMTKRGLALLKRVTKRLQKVQSQALAPLQQREWQALRKLLLKVLAETIPKTYR